MKKTLNRVCAVIAVVGMSSTMLVSQVQAQATAVAPKVIQVAPSTVKAIHGLFKASPNFAALGAAASGLDMSSRRDVETLVNALNEGSPLVQSQHGRKAFEMLRSELSPRLLNLSKGQETAWIQAQLKNPVTADLSAAGVTSVAVSKGKARKGVKTSFKARRAERSATLAKVKATVAEIVGKSTLSEAIKAEAIKASTDANLVSQWIDETGAPRCLKDFDEQVAIDVAVAVIGASVAKNGQGTAAMLDAGVIRAFDSVYSDLGVTMTEARSRICKGLCVGECNVLKCEAHCMN